MKTLILILTAFLAASTRADDFTFAYTLSDGHFFGGSFTGTIDGQLIDQVSALTATIDGNATPWRAPNFGPVYGCGNGYSGAPVFSFDASMNDFILADTDMAAGDFGNSWQFSITEGNVFLENLGWGITQLPDGSLVDLPLLLDYDSATQASWKLTDLSQQQTSGGQQSVPDGASTAFLLALALGLLAVAGGPNTFLAPTASLPLNTAPHRHGNESRARKRILPGAAVALRSRGIVRAKDKGSSN